VDRVGEVDDLDPHRRKVALELVALGGAAPVVTLEDDVERVLRPGLQLVGHGLDDGLVDVGDVLDDLEPLSERIAPLGWHVELLLPAALWPGITPRLRQLPIPVVLDHFGRLPHPGVEHPGHRAIVALLETDRVWVKLSGAYLQGVEPGLWAADAASMSAAYLRAAPHRLVWGSNWPHPTAHAGLHHAPEDVESLSLLRQWIGADANLHRILVDNPAMLYSF